MDQFDVLLISTASIMVRGLGIADVYGTSPPAFTIVATGIPCRVATGRGRPKEFKDVKKVGENYKLVFMRPWFDGNGNPLSHLHWLLIDGVNYDAFQIDVYKAGPYRAGDPEALNGHHLEVWCQLVLV